MNRPPITLDKAFYRSIPLPCPYLDNRTEQRIFTFIDENDSPLMVDLLSRVGFRRSQNTVYRPQCEGCSACVPVRVKADDFTPRSSLKRTKKANRDLTGTLVEATAGEENYALFTSYVRSRHGDGDMALMDFGDFQEMIEITPVETRLAEFRDYEGNLIGACLIDMMSDGLSAVYSFFDPKENHRSLGNYMIIWLIEETRRMALPHTYLGYWIENCQKMSYKTRFTPQEHLVEGQWQLWNARK